MIQFIPAVFWLSLITLKLYALFEIRGKYKAKQMMSAVEEELREMNIPQEWAKEILSEIDTKVGEKELTVEDFLTALKEVFDDLKKGTSKQFDAAVESIGKMTKEARQNLAIKLRQAADFLVKKE